MEKSAIESSSDIWDTELNKAENQELISLREQAHVLDGLRMVLPDKKIAETIRKHFDFNSARTHLVARFRLDKTQAEFVLNMPFERFHDLVLGEIESKYNALMCCIAALEKEHAPTNSEINARHTSNGNDRSME
jgi:DNA gyrase/topoisomerase IV subunit A